MTTDTLTRRLDELTEARRQVLDRAPADAAIDVLALTATAVLIEQGRLIVELIELINGMEAKLAAGPMGVFLK